MAAPWRALPDELPEATRWLVTELRALKDSSGLSLARLQIKTHYSKSSWERWLNGKQFPPREAVIRLAEVCGGDARLLEGVWARAAEQRPAAAQNPNPDPDGEQPAPSHRPRRPWRLVVAGAAVLAAVAGGGAAIAAHRRADAEPAPPPVAVAARLAGDRRGECQSFMINRPVAEVAPPSDIAHTRKWAGKLGGVDAKNTTLELTIQGLSQRAVVLHGLRVRIAGRPPRKPGTVFAPYRGCGKAIEKRGFQINLDTPSPTATPMPGTDANGEEIPPVDFPYEVSDAEPEVLVVSAVTEGCDCSWYLELEWSSQGRAGVLRIDDHGRPFRTIGATGVQRWTLDPSFRRWTPL